MIDGSLIRAARALIGWKPAQSGPAEAAVKKSAGRTTGPSPSTIAAIQKAFDEGTLQFIEPGDLHGAEGGARRPRNRLLAAFRVLGRVFAGARDGSP